jgi:hypothetical protein
MGRLSDLTTCWKALRTYILINVQQKAAQQGGTAAKVKQPEGEANQKFCQWMSRFARTWVRIPQADHENRGALSHKYNIFFRTRSHPQSTQADKRTTALVVDAQIAPTKHSHIRRRTSFSKTYCPENPLFHGKQGQRLLTVGAPSAA